MLMPFMFCMGGCIQPSFCSSLYRYVHYLEISKICKNILQLITSAL